MNHVVVTLRYETKDGTKEMDLALPATIPLSVLGPILAKQVAPKQSLTVARSYTARVRDQGLVVRPYETLAQAGVLDGNVVELVAHEQNPLPDGDQPGSYLKCLETGRIFRCRPENMLVGRLKECHVNLSSLPKKESVSRRHAQILFRNGVYSIQDWNSANGTIVDGHLLAQAERIRLRNGSQIEFGQGGPRLAFYTDRD